ncbi:MAG TPA: hypothetical protein VE553_00375, partial [Candidatus Binatia bacterium]|nr:hypothetical protein [Candidatus Binatia bacterium]
MMPRTHSSFRRRFTPFLILVLLATLGLVVFLPGVEAAPALQTTPTAEPEDESSAPVNLSHSGGASNPSMLVDNDGRFHVYWEDEFAGNFYVEGNESGHSEPVSVTVPFSGTLPLLLKGTAEQTSAFWIDEETDELLFSRTGVSAAAQVNTWQEPIVLDDTVLDYSAVLDSGGVVHVVYSRSTSTASRGAGVYYVRSEDQGTTWSEPLVLFESPYFRSLRAQDAHVTLESSTDSGDVYLYVAWDLRTRKRIYFTRSTNGGQSWDSISEIAGPESSSNIILPFNLQIGADAGNVLLVWQVGQPGAACQQFYRWSTDYGATFNGTQKLVDLLPGTASCAVDNEILVGSELFYLLSTFPQQAFLLAWNGEQWSDPQAQRMLTQFNNPETLNTVNLGCQQTALTNQDRLLVAGCDLTALDSSQGDIWLVSRLLGTLVDWFPSPDAWSTATAIIESTPSAQYVQLIADRTGLAHAFWSQTEPETDGPRAIYHSQWDGEDWTQPAQILSSPAPISGLDATSSPAADRAYIMWTTTTHDVYLSQAEGGQMEASTSWSPPEAIPLNTALASDPAIAVSSEGTVYIAYAESINEHRGIYVIRSDDAGRTWSESALIFDGQDAGWQIVGAPELAIAADGVLHLSFDQRSWTVGLDSVSQGLYYVRCSVTASECSAPEMVTEGEVMWKDIVAVDSGTIHQLWQSRSSEGNTLQHLASNDGGESWGRLNTLASNPDAMPESDTTVAVDSAGRLFVFAATGSSMQSWRWENDSWRVDETLDRALAPSVRHELGATITQSTDLVVIFTDERTLPLFTSEELADEPNGYAL